MKHPCICHNSKTAFLLFSSDTDLPRVFIVHAHVSDKQQLCACTYMHMCVCITTSWTSKLGMCTQGEMKEDGFGLVSWWLGDDDDDEEGGDMEEDASPSFNG